MLSEKRLSIVNQWDISTAAKQGVYRFLNNDSVNETDLISRLEPAYKGGLEAEGHVLVFQDTVELSYGQLSGKLRIQDQSIGVLSDNKTTGFLAHPGLALSAENNSVLGLSSLKLWSRPYGRQTKQERKYQKQAYEEKESYVWLESLKQSQANLSSAERITFISDRGSDIYELFGRVSELERKADLIIRSSHDRRLSTQQRLSEFLNTQQVGGYLTYSQKERKHRSSRKTNLGVKWAKVKIKRPSSCLGAVAEELELTVVELQEEAQHVPSGEKPICWRLWTTHEVTNLAEAKKIATWYAQRWWIEDFFRLIKKQGFKIEAAQFGTGAALRKLTILTMEQAVKVLALRQGRENIELSANKLFTEQEQVCLQALEVELAGKTKAQQNPYPQYTMAWAAWLIARLGGWTAANMSKRPPGNIVLRRGLERFQLQFKGWQLAQRKHKT